MLDKLLHCANAPVLMSVTVLGNVIDVNLEPLMATYPNIDTSLSKFKVPLCNVVS